MKQQTLDTKNVDGFHIIVGFQERVVDPVATKEKNGSKIIDLPENKEIINKIQAQNRHRENVKQAEKKSIAALMRNENKDGRGKKETDKLKIQANLAEIGKQDKIRNDLFGAIGVINEELKELNAAFKGKAKGILRENPVYNDEVLDPDGNPAGPRENELIKTQAEIETLKEKFLAKKKTEQVTVAGEVVMDFRGKIFYYKDNFGKWVRNIVEDLNDNLSAHEVYQEDLTPAQQKEISDQTEAERLTGMTQDEKSDEFELADDAVLSQAGLMRNKLEIKGDPEALIKSQEFYNVESEKLKLKYGVV